MTAQQQYPPGHVMTLGPPDQKVQLDRIERKLRRQQVISVAQTLLLVLITAFCLIVMLKYFQIKHAFEQIGDDFSNSATFDTEGGG